jgi:hypothetical protein
MTTKALITVLILSFTGATWSQAAQPTTRPTTQPSAKLSADDMLKQLLTPSRPIVKPLEPLPDPTPAIDPNTGKGAVAPGAPTKALIREGTMIWDRKGRLSRTPDGQHEFLYDADGKAMQDPPMIILPNLALMSMENAVKSAGRELRFRITGVVTEYGTRNYILLDKAVVVQEQP